MFHHRTALFATLLSLPLLAQAPAAQPQGAKAKLIAAQDAARANSEFAQHHFEATPAIARAAGAPLGPLRDAKGAALAANDAAVRLAAQGSGYREVTPEQAQTLANAGTLVIVAWSNPDGAGATATVRPQGVAGDDVHAGSRPPLINNIGVDVGIEGANWVFRKSAVVHYYTPGTAGGGQ